MTRPKPPLHQHLLTRSDLARLQVPAGEVLSWLADGLIEQVGSLPGAEGAPDPVFTVLSNRLRQDLALRLIGIGKPTVVLTPLRVRSFLMRALMGTASDGQATPKATNQDEQDLADVLREVVAEVEADVDDVLRLAAEEAELEAADAPPESPEPAASATPAPAEPAQYMGEPAAEHVDALPTEEASVEEGEADAESDLDPCFDADDIDAALNALDGDATPVVDPPVEESVSCDTPAAESCAPAADEAVAEATEHAEVAAATDAESPPAVEPTPSDPVVAVESIAPAVLEAGVEDSAGASNPDISMASETTMSSQPEAVAPPEPSTPVAAPVDAAVDAPSTEPGDSTPAASTEETAPGSPEPAEAEAASSTAVATEAPANEAAPTTEPAAAPETGDPAAEAQAEPIRPERTELPAPPATMAAESPAMEPATATASSTVSPEAIVHAAAEAVLERTVQRVESFLGELQKSLLTIAQRPEVTTPPPPPPPAMAFDVAPLVNALQAGLERSAQANAAMQAALSSLGDRVNGVGERMAAVAEGATGVGTHVEHGMQSLDKTLQALQTTVAHREAPKTERVVPGIVVATGDRMPTVMIAVAALVIAWSVVFWMKMDSPRLAIATLIGANLVSCCLLAGRRARS